jgi:polyhydroxyalkanoate synthesis regulator phasin
MNTRFALLALILIVISNVTYGMTLSQKQELYDQIVDLKSSKQEEIYKLVERINDIHIDDVGARTHSKTKIDLIQSKIGELKEEIQQLENKMQITINDSVLYTMK